MTFASHLDSAHPVIDLFAGPGGWDEGVAPLGIATRGIELDLDACLTGEAAGHRRIQGNVAAMNPREVFAPGETTPAGILGSPPCPGFSRGGKHAGTADARLLLRELARVDNLAELEAMMTTLDRVMTHEATLLAVEPLRWALALGPRWLAWEQVPAVLPLWDACARILRGLGYSVATGLVHAEQFGVPQDRERAVLVARDSAATAQHGPARLPVPMHSRYHPHSPVTIDEGLAPWRSMRDALGWSFADRVGFLRRDDGRADAIELDGIKYRARDLHPVTRPAPALTEKARSWQRVTTEGRERVTIAEASVLQGFGASYPWQGSRTSQFRQIANAVPPVLARRIVQAVAA